VSNFALSPVAITIAPLDGVAPLNMFPCEIKVGIVLVFLAFYWRFSSGIETAPAILLCARAESDGLFSYGLDVVIELKLSWMRTQANIIDFGGALVRDPCLD
jgi:hypothetical protein